MAKIYLVNFLHTTLSLVPEAMGLIVHVGPRLNVLGQQLDSTKSYIILFLWIGLKSCKPFQSKYRSKILLYLLSLKFIILFHITYVSISNCVFFFAFTHSNIVFLCSFLLNILISAHIFYFHFVSNFIFPFLLFIFFIMFLLTFEVPLT
jgi:hypothetical protein